MPSKIVTHKRKHNKLIDRAPVDDGVLLIGEDQVNLPTKLKDGIYPVYLSPDGCQIIIDITPFPDGFRPIEWSYTEWLRQVVKMRRKKAEAERLTN